MVFLRILFISTDTGTAQIVPIRCQRQCGNVSARETLDLSGRVCDSDEKADCAETIGVTELAQPGKEPSKDIQRRGRLTFVCNLAQRD
jgi:hypothetical protein